MNRGVFGGGILLGYLLAAPSVGAAGSVVVVDDDGGADFTTLQQAVDAAGEGDLILVRAGFYDGFDLVAKSLALVSDGAGEVRVSDTIRLSGNGPAQSVLLRGLTMPGSFERALELTDMQGPVRIESSLLIGGLSGFFGFVGPALRLTRCESVAFLHCDVLHGSVGVGAQLATAIDARDCGLVFYDSNVNGGEGVTCLSPGCSGGVGGTAVRLEGGSLVASGSSFSGGPGGMGFFDFFSGFCTPGGSGGVALDLVTAATAAFTNDCLLAGGIGGAGGLGCAAGGPGAATSGPGGLADFGRQATTFLARSPVHELGSAELEYVGEPGDGAFVLASADPGATFLPNYAGMLLTGGIEGVLFLGFVPPSGQITDVRPVSQLPSGLSHLVIHLQALAVTPVLHCTLGGATALVVLDQGI